MKNVSRNKDVVKRLEKSKEERKVDLAQAKEDRDREEANRKKKIAKVRPAFGQSR